MRRRFACLLLAALLWAVCCAGAEAPGTSDAPGPTPAPARGYVLVTTSTQQGLLPLPEEGEYSYPLHQVGPDGQQMENVIHVTADGVYMESSTCENQDCVNQGEVTLENRDERILSNMIICLPNLVYLELYTPEEIVEMFGTPRVEEEDQ